MVHQAHDTHRHHGGGIPVPRFEIHASRHPQALARIIGLLAAQNIVPHELHARQSCGGLWICLLVDLDPVRAERFAERLRAIVTVEAVILVPAPIRA